MYSVKIIVATHKKCDLPSDEIYLPLHVGAAGKFNPDGTPLDFGITKDNTGDNISEKNFCFGTQTGLYWAWKNLDTDYIGLVHYRRFFIFKKKSKSKNMLDSVLTKEQLMPLLGKYKVFIPKKRRYYIETIYTHYANTMDGSHLDISREIIQEMTPEYLEAFDIVMNRRYGHMFNMMILTKDLMNDYCSWLFKILFELERRVDTTGLTVFEKRFCGRVSERLFNVWLEYKIKTGELKKNEIKELSYIEDVDWLFKIKSFLCAKFFHKKYGVSS